MSEFVLYGTLGCHLCEQAEALLAPVIQYASADVPVVLKQQDIAESEELVARYGVRIPVLRCEMHNRELGWPFDQAQAFAFIQSCSGI